MFKIEEQTQFQQQNNKKKQQQYKQKIQQHRINNIKLMKRIKNVGSKQRHTYTHTHSKTSI